MRRPLVLFVLTLPLISSLACSGTGAHSTAADETIAKAADGEERAGLTQARDDIDAEMSAVASQRDAEIDRLKKENEELRARLAARAKR